MTALPEDTTLELSRALIDARRSGHRADVSRFPTPDYATALKVQQQVQSSLGAVGGFKVARRAEGSPVIAPITADGVLPSGSVVQTADRMGIELEIGFELISDTLPSHLDAPGKYFRPRIVLELVDTRLAGADHDPLMKLADMQVNAGLVVGPVLEDWDGEDFSTVEAFLNCGGQQIVDGPVTVPGGSALAMLSLFLDHAGDHCGGLQPGQIVITGTLSGLLFFGPGTDVLGRIAGFGEVSCHLG